MEEVVHNHLRWEWDIKRTSIGSFTSAPADLPQTSPPEKYSVYVKSGSFVGPQSTEGMEQIQARSDFFRITDKRHVFGT